MRVVLEGKKAGRCIFGKFLYVSLMKVVISKRRTHAINRNAVGQLVPLGLTLADTSKREQQVAKELASNLNGKYFPLPRANSESF